MKRPCRFKPPSHTSGGWLHVQRLQPPTLNTFIWDNVGELSRPMTQRQTHSTLWATVTHILGSSRAEQGSILCYLTLFECPFAVSSPWADALFGCVYFWWPTFTLFALGKKWINKQVSTTSYPGAIQKCLHWSLFLVSTWPVKLQEDVEEPAKSQLKRVNLTVKPLLCGDTSCFYPTP